MGDDPAIAVSSWEFMLRQAEVARLAQLLADPTHPTVLVAGEAGVGKSRLTEHVLQRHLLGGAPGRRCLASSSLADVPFGALVGLVPAHHMAAVAAGTQQLSVFSMVREHILDSGATDQRPFVICVDDLHHLDDASCGLLVQLTGNAPVQLLATYRSGEPLPDGALPLWTASSAVRLDIAPFDRDDTDEIVQRIMGATTPEVSEALWQQSRGNALYLRELIVGSVAARRIVMHAGTWVLAQPLVGSAHLGEYLLQRVRHLD
ncbi:MAG: AAA family ATPase, partial [Actinomycetota bacterium]|nr:AAA family ATPase [Actinomycetota bacterium]